MSVLLFGLSPSKQVERKIAPEPASSITATTSSTENRKEASTVRKEEVAKRDGFKYTDNTITKEVKEDRYDAGLRSYSCDDESETPMTTTSRYFFLSLLLVLLDIVWT